MLTLVTDKRPNGRRLIILTLEPQDIEHVKTGQPVSADSSKIEGHDILVSFVPDGLRFRNMIASELPNVNLQTFAQLLKTAQQYPEVHRRVNTDAEPTVRQDVEPKRGRPQ